MELVLSDSDVRRIAQQVLVLAKEDKEFVKQLIPQPARDTRISTWVGMAELQEKTGWGRSKLESWRKQGKFQYRQDVPGGKYTYNLEDVNRFLRTSGISRK